MVPRPGDHHPRDSPGNDFNLTPNPAAPLNVFVPIRTASRCPDGTCCRLPDAEVSARWSHKAWPSARLHAHILSPLPSGTFPGVDDNELYAFLDAHSRK